MRNIHFVIHEYYEGPGAFIQWISDQGYASSFTRLYQNEILPENSSEFDMLVVLGGPQGPDTTKEECPYFDAAAEMNLINDFIDHEKMVVGVCLGAQLIGQALGANHERSDDTEIGSFPILMTPAGEKHTKFSHFPSTVTVGHWHNDMAGLTQDAKILAYSDGCPRQIIEYSELVYGLQCHLEFTKESVKDLLDNSKEELSISRNKKYVQGAEEIQNYDYKEMNNLLFSFLNKLVQQYDEANNIISI